MRQYLNYVDGKITYPKGGYTKVYLNTLNDLLDKYTKKEILSIFDLIANIRNYPANIIKGKLKDIFILLNKNEFRTFRSKILDDEIIYELDKDIYMINPFIVLPKEVKDIENFQYKIQQLWIWLVKNCDITDPELQTLVNRYIYIYIYI